MSATTASPTAPSRSLRRGAVALVAVAGLGLGGFIATAPASAAGVNEVQLGWGQTRIAAAGCATFVTPTYDWASMHTQMKQYLCWRNGRVTVAADPISYAWVDWHGRALRLSVEENRHYSQLYNGGISNYARGEFEFRQQFTGFGWRPAISIRLRARDQIVTPWAWSR